MAQAFPLADVSDEAVDISEDVLKRRLDLMGRAEIAIAHLRIAPRGDRRILAVLAMFKRR